MTCLKITELASVSVIDTKHPCSFHFTKWLTPRGKANWSKGNETVNEPNNNSAGEGGILEDQ